MHDLKQNLHPGESGLSLVGRLKILTGADRTIEKEVSNQQSKKALAAQEARRLAREERSKERNTNRQQRQRKSPGQKPQKGKKEDEQGPIQSKRTSGDGRTKKRRK